MSIAQGEMARREWDGGDATAIEACGQSWAQHAQLVLEGESYLRRRGGCSGLTTTRNALSRIIGSSSVANRGEMALRAGSGNR